MRLRKRRRRMLIGTASFVYLVALAWLLSPLWRPAEGASLDHAQVSSGAAARAIGISPLGSPKALPERLPGSSTVTAGASESESTEPVSEVGSEATATTATLPEGGESSATPTPEAESSESSREETIIGFEG